MGLGQWTMRRLGYRRKRTDEHGADIGAMIAGHARFQRQFTRDRAFYAKLAKQQSPRLLWIGCCDSRVVPDAVLDTDPGALFVVRNIANLVPPANTPASISVGAAIEYAVTVLGISDIVVCGHTHCGGVAALAKDQAAEDASHLAQWIDIARAGYDPATAPTMDEAVRRNVLWQLRNLMTYEVVRDAWEAGTVDIHGWLYDIETGIMHAFNAERQSWGSLSDSNMRALLAESGGEAD